MRTAIQAGSDYQYQMLPAATLDVIETAFHLGKKGQRGTCICCCVPPAGMGMAWGMSEG